MHLWMEIHVYAYVPVDKHHLFNMHRRQRAFPLRSTFLCILRPEHTAEGDELLDIISTAVFVIGRRATNQLYDRSNHIKFEPH